MRDADRVLLVGLAACVILAIGPEARTFDGEKEFLELSAGAMTGASWLRAKNELSDAKEDERDQDTHYAWGLTAGVVFCERLKIDAEYLRMPDIMGFREADTNLFGLGISYRLLPSVVAPYAGLGVAFGRIAARDHSSERGSFDVGSVHARIALGVDFLIGSVVVLFAEGRLFMSFPDGAPAIGWTALAGARIEIL